MLRSVGSGSTKTHIMYKAYLSYSQLVDYLSVLEERNLIVYEKGTQQYRTTERGLRFMNAYDKISELIPSTENRNEMKGLEAKSALLTAS